MANMRMLNFVLVIFILVLGYNYFVQEKSITGAAVYAPVPENFQCNFISPDNQVSEIGDINRCCYALESQLHCEQIGDNYLCYNIRDSWRYEVNSETHGYCEASKFVIPKN